MGQKEIRSQLDESLQKLDALQRVTLDIAGKVSHYHAFLLC